jgi:phosphodiesterase/alkaline phosphatase D-like protein
LAEDEKETAETEYQHEKREFKKKMEKSSVSGAPIIQPITLEDSQQENSQENGDELKVEEMKEEKEGMSQSPSTEKKLKVVSADTATLLTKATVALAKSST